MLKEKARSLLSGTASLLSFGAAPRGSRGPEAPPGLGKKLETVTGKEIRRADSELMPRDDIGEPERSKTVRIGSCSDYLKRLVAYARRCAETGTPEGWNEAEELGRYAAQLCKDGCAREAPGPGAFQILRGWKLVFIPD